MARTPATPESDRARWVIKVEIPADAAECHRWTAAFFATGYGSFYVDGENQRAHVVAYRWFVGDVAPGMDVSHTCPGGGNRWCVNPLHLTLEPHKRNMERAVEAGRTAVGDRNGSRTRPDRVPRGDAHWSRRMPERRARGNSVKGAKLTDDIVRGIRRLAADGVPQKDLATQFSVSRGTISMIVSRKIWQHVQ